MQCKQLLKPNTKAVYIETPTNPMMEITDVRALSKMAHDRVHLFIVDNTFLSLISKTVHLGADIDVHSGTKFIGGHHDVISSYHCKDDELAAQLRLIYKTVGAFICLLIAGLSFVASKLWRPVGTASKECHRSRRMVGKQEPKVTKVVFLDFQNIQAMK